MKKLWLVSCFIFMCALPASAWRITSIDTVMDVQKDSSVIITEVIRTDFTGDPHHGIFREIPLSGTDRYGNKYRIHFKLISVTDENGISQRVQKSMKSGGRINLRIGDPDVYVSDQRVYTISYRLMRTVHFFTDHDEIYANAVGHEWEVPVENASCTVNLPSDVQNGQIQIAAYTGIYGSTSSEAAGYVASKRTASFRMNRRLFPGEGMTIVVGWPKGMVSQPPLIQEALWFVSDNAYFFLPILFILGLVIVWWNAGRDPDTGWPVTVMYDPPDNLSPAEVGTLIDECVDMRDISASIIDMAVKGYIRVKPEVEKGFLSSKTDYLLTLIPQFDTLYRDAKLSAYELSLLRNIFGGQQSTLVSSLEGTFYSSLPMLRDNLYDAMVDKGYFTHRPDSIRKSYQFAGFGIIALVFLPSFFDMPDLIPLGWSISIAICGLALVLAARTMPRKTSKGKKAHMAIKGFEEYLSRAERIEIEHQERNNYFEKFLPYALAFGIAHKWAKAFEGLQMTPPDWYDGDYTTFHPSIFAHDMSIASRSWGQSMSTRPRSEGSGSGGFFGGGSGFGGGSSGGGSGGGGGGAW